MPQEIEAFFVELSESSSVMKTKKPISLLFDIDFFGLNSSIYSLYQKNYNANHYYT